MENEIIILVLKKAIEKGDIISVDAEKPRLHAEKTPLGLQGNHCLRGCQGRLDDNLTTPYKKQLYPRPG